MRLLLVRHAQTASNIGRALDTAIPGAVLTGLGHEQAARLVERLAGEHLDVVAASPLLRARQTAGPVAAARGLTPVILDGLREIEAGDLEMGTSAPEIESYRDVIAAWATGAPEVVMPGGSSGHEFFSRFDGAVRSLENAGTRAAAVSHGAAIRTWAALRCRNANSAEFSRRLVPNTGVVIVKGSTRSGWLLDGRIEEGTDAIPADAVFNAVGETE